MKNVKSTSTFKPDSRDVRPDPTKDDQTDWVRVRAITDADVEAAVHADPSEGEMTVDWSQAKVVLPDRKRTMTIRLDSDVLEFYRGMGRGYQTAINAVLRSYMEHAKS